MIRAEFPHVDIPVDVDPEGAALVKRAIEAFHQDKSLKVKHAVAMLRMGVQPYRRPSASEVAKRRKRGKAQRQARKAHR